MMVDQLKDEGEELLQLSNTDAKHLRLLFKCSIRNASNCGEGIFKATPTSYHFAGIWVATKSKKSGSVGGSVKGLCEKVRE